MTRDTIAEAVKAAYHTRGATKGGVPKLAREMDPLVSITSGAFNVPGSRRYYFHDGSLLVTTGRGRSYRMEAFSDE